MTYSVMNDHEQFGVQTLDWSAFPAYFFMNLPFELSESVTETVKLQSAILFQKSMNL